jgi:hypothetical protein
VGELNSRPRIVDEDEDMADVKTRPREALAVVERERQRLRLPQLGQKRPQLTDGKLRPVEVEPQVDRALCLPSAVRQPPERLQGLRQVR